MVVRVCRVLPVVCLAACIESNRPRFVVDTAGDTATEDGAADTREEDTPETAADVEGACFNDNDCPAPAIACQRVACEDNTCVVSQRGDGEGCDDGDPCTGDGTCKMGDCQRGPPVVNGLSCDDGLACNGVRTCQDGDCAFAVAPTCPESTNQCAIGVACSEDAVGLCVDVPAEDGTACDAPADGQGWVCHAGACVPPDMVFVAGGVFTMGCPEGSCGEDNFPAHEVQLSPFAIDLTEVSEGMFRRCRDDADGRGTSCRPRMNEEAAEVLEALDEEPARWIDWANAEAVCAYQGKRLCTEAEWELAARGSDETRFYPWGNLPPTCDRVVFHEDSRGPGCGTNGPLAVGSKPAGASVYGALDMAGNVLEWVADYYVRELYKTRAGQAVVDPLQDTRSGPESHVVRGGSYRDGFALLRVFVRTAMTSEIFDDDLGTRCCMSLP